MMNNYVVIFSPATEVFKLYRNVYVRIFWYKKSRVIGKLKQYIYYRQRFQISSHNNVQSGARTRALNYAHVD